MPPHPAAAARPSEHATWATRAAEELARSWSAAAGWRARSALWTTAATSYAEVGLPPGFVLRELAVAGSFRRVAFARGAGRPLVIFSGLYAALGEQLFVSIAAAAQAAGRQVWLVEDRFASGTLALNAPSVPRLATLAREADELITLAGERPDVLALSAGAASALFARAPIHRMVVWSGAFDPRAVLAHSRRSLLIGRHFRRAHLRAFRRAGMAPPELSAFAAALAQEPAPAPTSSPLLLVHALNDPVALSAPVEALSLGPGQARCLLPHGGHLGFGNVLGVDAYLAPLG